MPIWVCMPGDGAGPSSAGVDADGGLELDGCWIGRGSTLDAAEDQPDLDDLLVPRWVLGIPFLLASGGYADFRWKVAVHRLIDVGGPPMNGCLIPWNWMLWVWIWGRRRWGRCHGDPWSEIGAAVYSLSTTTDDVAMADQGGDDENRGCG
ncbi:hypothetical protein ACLOJK_014773 [Asimina triloba]